MLKGLGRTKFLFIFFSHNFSVSSVHLCELFESLGWGLYGNQSGLWHFAPLTCHLESIWTESKGFSCSPSCGLVYLLMRQHWQFISKSQHAGQSNLILRHSMKFWGRRPHQDPHNIMRRRAGKSDTREVWEWTLTRHQLDIVPVNGLMAGPLAASWSRNGHPHFQMRT